MRRCRSPVRLALGHDITLADVESRHLRDVLRLTEGTHIEVYDDAGQCSVATIATLHPAVTVRILEMLSSPTVTELALVLAVTKGPAMDLAIRMAIETGVTHIRPFRASRSIPKAGKRERWKRIAESAVQQCRRTDKPVIDDIRALPEVLASVPATHDRRLAHFDGPRMTAASGPATLLVGPEGGLTEPEVRSALDTGFVSFTLGPWVMRVPTAVAAACAMTLPESSTL